MQFAFPAIGEIWRDIVYDSGPGYTLWYWDRRLMGSGGTRLYHSVGWTSLLLVAGARARRTPLNASLWQNLHVFVCDVCCVCVCALCGIGLLIIGALTRGRECSRCMAYLHANVRTLYFVISKWPTMRTDGHNIIHIVLFTLWTETNTLMQRWWEVEWSEVAQVHGELH